MKKNKKKNVVIIAKVVRFSKNPTIMIMNLV